MTTPAWAATGKVASRQPANAMTTRFMAVFLQSSTSQIGRSRSAPVKREVSLLGLFARRRAWTNRGWAGWTEAGSAGRTETARATLAQLLELFFLLVG